MMPRITDLKLQKSGKRVNLFLDGKYLTSLKLETVAKYGLKQGQPPPPTFLQDEKQKEEKGRLRDSAIRYISYRPRSQAEMHHFLNRKWRGVAQKSEHQKWVKQLMKELKAKQLIDDRAFAQWWIDQRQIFRPKGKRAIAQELARKGIAKEVIDALLANQDERKEALAAAQKLIPKIRGREPATTRQRLIGFLQRRGFTWETIKNIVDETLNKR